MPLGTDDGSMEDITLGCDDGDTDGILLGTDVVSHHLKQKIVLY